MMSFNPLLQIYRHTCFDEDGKAGSLKIANQEILVTLKLIEQDEGAARDSGIFVPESTENISVGKTTRIEIGLPRTGLGRLALDVDTLLKGPEAYLKEPDRYYLIHYKFANGDTEVPDVLERYRKVCKIIKWLEQAALITDEPMQKLFFIRDGKFILPVEYSSDDLQAVDVKAIDGLQDFMADDVHRDQKLVLLGELLIDMTHHLTLKKRFSHLLLSLPALLQKLQDGYTLNGGN